MGTKSLIRKPPTVLMSTCLLLIWFTSSLCSTLVNKGLMDTFPYAVTLSTVHMFSSACVDLAIVWYRGLNINFRRDVVWSSLPVASAINFGKIMTYVSYGLVPASLTHTAKASSPVFTVIVSKILFNQVPNRATFLSLIPITIGVTLSALTEINWVFWGFFAAVAAALANVLNSTYTKKGLHHINAPDPLIFHMYTACVAVMMLLPYAIFVEMPTITLWQSSVPIAPVTALVDGVISPPQPVIHVFPWRAMFFSVILHYIQNISNIYFLNGVSVLTHQVAQSLKRLVQIGGAVLYFGNHVAPLNAAGMLLALCGFSMYSAAKQRPAIKPPPTPITTKATTASSTNWNHAHAVSPSSLAIDMNGVALSQRVAKGPAGILSSPNGINVRVEPNGIIPTTLTHDANKSVSIASALTHSYSSDELAISASPDLLPALHPTAHAQTLHAHALAAAAAAAASSNHTHGHTHGHHPNINSFGGEESPKGAIEHDFCV